MSSIRSRPETGLLYFDFHFRGKRYREYTALEDTPANRKTMQKVLDRIDHEIRKGTFQYARYFPNSKKAPAFEALAPSKPAEDLYLPTGAQQILTQRRLPMFKDFVAQWETQKRVEWRHSYQTAVDVMLATHLMPFFGDTALNAISRQDVLAFRTELARRRIGATAENGYEGKPLSPSTINRIMGILRMIMDEAAMHFEIQNPCLSVKRLKVPRKDIHPFSMDEVQQLIERVRPDYRPYLTLRFFTGLRSGEAHGLRWKHVDFLRNQLLIRETFSNGRTEYTKTDGSQREIHLSLMVREALMQMRPDGYDRSPRDFDEVYVFRTRRNTPLDNTNFNDRVWKPLLRNLGLAYRRPYQMRHTCATLWLASGEAPEWIARQLGHTTTEMLFRIYSRFVPNLTRRDGSAFDSFVGEKIQNTTAANDALGIAIGMRNQEYSSND